MLASNSAEENEQFGIVYRYPGYADGHHPPRQLWHPWPLVYPGLGSSWFAARKDCESDGVGNGDPVVR